MAKFILVGPHEGKTIKLDRFEFVDGTLEFHGSPQDMQAMAFHLGTYYSAFHESVVDLARAKYAESQNLEIKEPVFAPAGDPNVSPQEPQKLADELAPPPPVVDDPLEHDPLADVKPATVAEALQLLDPDKGTDWTGQGLPSVDAVSAKMGRTVTRKEIEEAADGFNLVAAKAAKAN